MYKDHTVISTCPAGRRRYLEILAPYLLRNRHLIDEHHWWANTLDPDDLDFIQRLCSEHPDYFKMVAAPVEPRGSLTVHAFFTDEYRRVGVLYLRFDDDICYIADDAIEKLLEFRLDHPEYFLVFANIINNGIQDHIRQRMGLIEYAPFRCSMRGSSHGSPLFAEASHWTFLRHHRDERLQEHKRMFYQWICVYHERVSIN